MCFCYAQINECAVIRFPCCLRSPPIIKEKTKTQCFCKRFGYRSWEPIIINHFAKDDFVCVRNAQKGNLLHMFMLGISVCSKICSECPACQDLISHQVSQREKCKKTCLLQYCWVLRRNQQGNVFTSYSWELNCKVTINTTSLWALFMWIRCLLVFLYNEIKFNKYKKSLTF